MGLVLRVAPPRGAAVRRSLAVAGAIAAALVAAPAPEAAPPLPPTLVRHLQAEGFTSADLATIAAGRAVARGLPRAERDEAGAIGVVRIDLPPDVFADRFRDIVRFEQGSGVSAVGRLGLPPTVADLDGYTCLLYTSPSPRDS